MVHKAESSPINLSFSGCGFLGLYHVGVVCAFKEHAPEVFDGPMAGCSAGSLVAACAMTGCCLGQMCSDALEIAIRARSRALGPLHPTFNIVDIIRNGLRRILPPDAHEICSGRLYISLTRWKDNKNVIINQYHSREELIQVLICSSFVPYWSGIIPHRFRGEYYWDGGLTNNNPIINDGTILISPFAGESDICPRDESGSFYSVDFRGTDISCTQENLYRMTRALFPPSISVLKQICWRGYIDGLKFLQTRNMVHSSYLSSKTSISSVLGCNYTEPAHDEEVELANGGIVQNVDRMYEPLDNVEEEAESMDDGYDDSSYRSDDESNADTSQVTYSPYCERFTRKKDLPTPLFAVFADARQKEEDPIRRYFTDSRIYKVGSIMALPVTLPLDMTYAVTKRVLGIFRPSAPANKQTPSNRAVDYFWSFFADDQEDRSCYHVQDCECTESRASTRSHPRVARRPRPTTPSRARRLNLHNLRSSDAPMSTAASTSSRSDSSTDDDDDEDISTVHHDDTQYLSAVSNHVEHLPEPDLVASTKASNFNDEYCHHLQQMADLSNQQRSHEQSSSSTIPFFGKDDHVIDTQTDAMPTSDLEKAVLFN